MFFNNKKKRLLEWQQLLIPKSTKLILSEFQLKEMTNETVNNHLKIINDCCKILQTTVKPEVFFSRLNLLFVHTKAITVFEPYINFVSVNPSQALNKAIEEKQEVVFEFLKRYFSSVLDKIDTLKTEKSKLFQLQKFYDSLQKYQEYIDKKNIDYYTNQYNEYANIIKPNQKFNTSDKFKTIDKIDKEKFFYVSNTLNSSSSYSPWNDCKNPDDEYTNTIFLSIFQFGHVLSSDPNSYPRWLSYRLNVTNPIAKQNEMLQKGYIEKENFQSALKKLKVNELKEILKKYDIIHKGKKADLIELVINNVNPELIENQLNFVYVLSTTGNVFVESNQRYLEIFRLHNRYQVTASEFFELEKYYDTNLSVKEITWNIINDRYMFFFQNRNYGFARCELLYCAYFLEDEQKLTDSLKYYIWVLYYDVSGNHNGSSIDSYDEIILASGIIEKLQKYKEYYNDNMVENCYKNIILPNIYLTQNQFIKLLQLIFDNNYSQKLVENNLCQ